MREGNSEQVYAAMRVLGINPQYIKDADELGKAVDELKRTLIDDFESSRKISESISKDSMVKTRVISALAQSVASGYFPEDLLKEREVRAGSLRPGMFANIKGDRCVIISVHHNEGLFGSSSLSIFTDPIGGHEDGRGGCMYGGVAGSQIFSASIGVADMIDRSKKDDDGE